MSDPAPCTRHARTVWMAHCPTCTAWHLTSELARRTRAGAGADPRPIPTADIREATRGVGPFAAAGSRAA